MQIGGCGFERQCVFSEIGYCVHNGADHLLHLLLLGWELGITWADEHLDLPIFENSQ